MPAKRLSRPWPARGPARSGCSTGTPRSNCRRTCWPTPAVSSRDANGKDARIEKKEIDTRDKLPTSIMPEDVAKTLTEEELVDVVEYLTTLQVPALTPDSWQVLGPFENGPHDEGLDKAFGP